jgi:hypothetical protein
MIEHGRAMPNERSQRKALRRVKDWSEKNPPEWCILVAHTKILLQGSRIEGFRRKTPVRPAFLPNRIPKHVALQAVVLLRVPTLYGKVFVHTVTFDENTNSTYPPVVDLRNIAISTLGAELKQAEEALIKSNVTPSQWKTALANLIDQECKQEREQAETRLQAELKIMYENGHVEAIRQSYWIEDACKELRATLWAYRALPIETMYKLVDEVCIQVVHES